MRCSYIENIELTNTKFKPNKTCSMKNDFFRLVYKILEYSLKITINGLLNKRKSLKIVRILFYLIRLLLTLKN